MEEEIKFNPCVRLKLTDMYVQKVKQIAEYMIRDTGIELNVVFADFISFKLPYNWDKKKPGFGTSYERLEMADFVYYHIPHFFNLGKIEINLGDPAAIIDIHLEKLKELTINEETSELMPVTEFTKPKEAIIDAFP